MRTNSLQNSYQFVNYFYHYLFATVIDRTCLKFSDKNKRFITDSGQFQVLQDSKTFQMISNLSQSVEKNGLHSLFNLLS